MKTLKIGDLLARLPIIQGGMGVGVSLAGLASADNLIITTNLNTI